MEVNQYLNIHERYIPMVYKLFYHKSSTYEFWSDGDRALY